MKTPNSDVPILELVKKLQKLLGPCVFLACNGKKPIKRGWQKLTLKDMTPEYLASLDGGNIGVSLGAPSEGLVSVDFDAEDALTLFLAANPALQNTLRTHARRGANLWLRVVGHCPASTRLVGAAGEPLGEWRATGGQTIIHGLHPLTGAPYEIQRESSPAQIVAADLKWPETVTPLKWPGNDPPSTGSRGEEEHRSTELSDSSAAASSASSHLHHTTTAKQIAALEAEAAFPRKYRKGIVELYNALVAGRYKPEESARNAFMIHAVPFLAKALDDDLVLGFSLHFFQLNQVLFKAGEAEHMEKTRAMLTNVLRTYEEAMSAANAILYRALPSLLKSAFRICEDLAFNHSSKAPPPPLFFLAEGELADRLNAHPQTARRLLHTLRSLQIIAVEVLGCPHAHKKRGVATQYRWLLSPPGALVAVRLQ